MSDELKVECYSGHKYAQEPRAFVWRGVRYEVEAVERAWVAPDGAYFVVRVADRARYELRYDFVANTWQIRKVERKLIHECKRGYT